MTDGQPKATARGRTGKHTPRACDSCYRRKIKCDTALPRCDYCNHHNLLCTFTRLERGKATDHHSLANNLEKNSHHFLPHSIVEDDTPRNDQPLDPAVGLHFSGAKQPPLTLFWGIPTFSTEARNWIKEITGQTMAFAKVYEEEVPNERLGFLDAEIMRIRSQTIDMCTLPDIALVESILRAYQSSDLQCRYPAVDPMLFQATIASAYNQNPLTSNTRNASSRACVYAFLSLIPLLSEDYSLLSLTDCELCATKARCLMSEALNEAPSLDSLQASTILSFRGIISGALQTAIYFNPIAIRLVFMLAGHVAGDDKASALPHTSPHESSHVRNLFWLCYMTDKELSFRCGHPPSIDDSQCDMSLPPNYAEHIYPDVSEAEMRTQLIQGTVTFPYDIRLSIIKSKMLFNIYSPVSLRRSRYEMERSIREIERNLGEWRLSILPSWQPPPVGLTPEHPTTAVPPATILLTWFEYYQCASMLHLVRGQYGILSGMHSVSKTNLLFPSLAVSIDASRQVLCNLEFSSSLQSVDASWIGTFPVPLAALIIFWSILQDRSSTSAREDVQLLLSAANYLAFCCTAFQLPVQLLRHFTSMSHYLGEFYTLASAAISNPILGQTNDTA